MHQAGEQVFLRPSWASIRRMRRWAVTCCSPVAILHPNGDEVARLETPLSDGERRVLDRLLAKLDDRFHVFVQPHVLDLHPDFVVAAQHQGVTVIEVKDWTPSLYRSANGMLEVQSHGRWERIAGRDGDPLRKVHDYRRGLANRFVSPPDDDTFPAVRGTLWFVQHEAGAGRALATGTTALGQKEARFVGVAGRAAFTSDDAFDRAVWGGARAASGLSQAAFDRVLVRLGEPEVIADRRRPLDLSEGGRDVATNPNKAKVRRIRGPAGSGKSLGLAARAARLASERNKVLVLSFNITLAHYLQDLVRREARQLGADHRLVDCIHFHGLCASIADLADDDGAIEGDDAAEVADPAALHEADVAVLTNEHKLGSIAADLIAARGIAVESLFSDDDTERRWRKMRFWPGANALKASTVHSFKGWEARAVVLAVTDAVGEAELAYVGLSRVKGWPERPAFVTVVNADGTFDGFKDRFERELSVEEVPGLAGQTALDVP